MTNSPLSLPAFPDELQSKVAGEARKLHSAAVAAVARLAEVHEAIANAEEEARLASEALDAEVVRGARAGANVQLERRLADKLHTARELAEPRRCELRIRAALDAQHEAVRAFLSFCAAHAADLLAEVAEQADAAAEDYREALAETEEILRGPLERRAEVEHLARVLIPCVEAVDHPGATDWSLPSEPAAAPLPPVAREIIERAADVKGYDARLEAEQEAARQRVRDLQAAAQRHEAELEEAQRAGDALTRRAMRGQLSQSESTLQLHMEHPVQIRLRELREGSLAQCLDRLRELDRRVAAGGMHGPELDAWRRGEHPLQRAVAEHPANAQTV